MLTSDLKLACQYSKLQDSIFFVSDITWKTTNHNATFKILKTLAAYHWLIFTWDAHTIFYYLQSIVISACALRKMEQSSIERGSKLFTGTLLLHLSLFVYWVFVHVHESSLILQLEKDTGSDIARLFPKFLEFPGRWRFMTFVNMVSLTTVRYRSKTSSLAALD